MTNLDRGGVIPPPDPWPVPDDVPPRPGRRGWWALAVVVLAATAALGFTFLSAPTREGQAPAREGQAPTREGQAPAEEAVAPREQAGPSAASTTVVYEVTSDGPTDVGSIQYTDQDGDIITRGGVPLPWRLTFTMTGERRPLVLVAQRKKGATGPVSCSITYGKKVLTTATETGRYEAPQCSA